MAKRKTEVVTPTWNTRAKVGQADNKKKPLPEGDTSQRPVKGPFACKVIRVTIPEDPDRLKQLSANLKTMGCEGLLDVAWHHKEPAWLQEIWGKDRSAFPNTIRADPALFREDLLGKVFGIKRDGVPLPVKVKGFNYAAKYFTYDPNTKEGWKFSECKNEELRDVFEFLTPLVNPMKPARITGKLASRVVENLYINKLVSWAQILENVIAQQVKLMGPKNPKVCLAGLSYTPPDHNNL
jgi:hypothetical protein